MIDPTQSAATLQTIAAGAPPLAVAGATPAPVTADMTPPVDPATLTAGLDTIGQLPLDRRGVSPSFGSQVMQAAGKLGIPTKPNGQPEPMGWAKSLVGGVQSALSGVTSALANANVGKIPEGAGGIYGITKAAQNIQAANRQKTADQQEAIKAADQHQRDQILNAQTQAKTVSDAISAQRLSDEDMQKRTDSGKTAADALRKHHEIMGENLTEDDIKQGMKAGGKFDPATSIAYQTGTESVEKNGEITRVPTWTVFKRSAEPVEVSADAAALLKKYGQEIPEGTKMDADKYDYAMTQAIQTQTAANLLAAQNKKSEIESVTEDHLLQHKKDVEAVAPVLGKHADDPITALTQLSQQVDKTGQLVPQAAAAKRILADYDPKELEQHRHNVQDEKQKAIDEAEKAKEDAQKEIDKKASKAKYQGSPDPNVTGQAFLNSLDPNERPMVQDIGTGKMALNRLEYLAARNPDLLDAVARAYPDFDGSKIKNYVDINKEFTSGKAANALRSGGTAMEHLKRLYDNSTFTGKFIPGTDAYQQRQKDLDTVSIEIAKFDNGGTAPTEKEITSARNSIDSVVNPKAAIKEKMHLMSDNLANYQTQWDNAAPSAAYHQPMPNISAGARAARDYVLGDGKAPGVKPPAPVPSSHQFNPAAWAAANPGKDVNAAIAAARARGYEVQQ